MDIYQPKWIVIPNGQNQGHPHLDAIEIFKGAVGRTQDHKFTIGNGTIGNTGYMIVSTYDHNHVTIYLRKPNEITTESSGVLTELTNIPGSGDSAESDIELSGGSSDIIRSSLESPDGRLSKKRPLQDKYSDLAPSFKRPRKSGGGSVAGGPFSPVQVPFDRRDVVLERVPFNFSS